MDVLGLSLDFALLCGKHSRSETMLTKDAYQNRVASIPTDKKLHQDQVDQDSVSDRNATFVTTVGDKAMTDSIGNSPNQGIGNLDSLPDHNE